MEICFELNNIVLGSIYHLVAELLFLLNFSYFHLNIPHKMLQLQTFSFQIFFEDIIENWKEATKYSKNFLKLSFQNAFAFQVMLKECKKPATLIEVGSDTLLFSYLATFSLPYISNIYKNKKVQNRNLTGYHKNRNYILKLQYLKQ